jgi:hypothetical protein
LLVVLKCIQVPSRCDIDDFGLTKNVMLDFFINEPLGSENVDEQLFNHHAENITVLKPEHEFH